MTQVHGKIESLKRVHQELIDHGISEFNSIKEINIFISNYQNNFDRITNETWLKIQKKAKELIVRKGHIEKAITEISLKIDDQFIQEVSELESKILTHLEKKHEFRASSIINNFNLQLTKRKLIKTELKKAKLIHNKTKSFKLELHQINEYLERVKSKDISLVVEESDKNLSRIQYLNRVVMKLRPIIAGAIGENQVQKMLTKLSGHNYLINDFNLNFTPPIYNKKTGDRIFNIQIDHLLISDRGLFLIETKNWSNESISNLDLRSPVTQIKRSSYALFTFLNSDRNINSFYLSHPWGERKIDVKSIIVFINALPKQKFKYVKILHLQMLNNYIQHFEPIYNKYEVEELFKALKSIIGSK